MGGVGVDGEGKGARFVISEPVIRGGLGGPLGEGEGGGW